MMKKILRENFLKMITSYNSELGASVDRNFKIWGYSFNLNMLIGGNRDITSYEQANLQLYNAIDKRFKFLDENRDYGAVFTNVQPIDGEGHFFNNSNHFYYSIFNQSNFIFIFSY